MSKRRPSATLCECGNHAFAPLTKGGVALVSPEDIDVLLESCWRVHIGRSTYRTILSSNGGKHILARRVMGAPDGVLVDHKNRDTADCRRENLRLCDKSQNGANSAGWAGRSLPKGVTKSGDKYAAAIGHRRQRLYLGTYSTVEAAAKAYAAVAISLFGEFARFE